MQVSVETTGSLERSVTVDVPEERISTEVESRLVSMAKTTRVQGFRPGKAPLRVIKQRFGAQVRREVVEWLIGSSFREAVARERLTPAGAPLIDPLKAEPGQGLSYTARFEVIPEVTLNPVDKLEMKKPTCEISDDDVSRAIEKLRWQRRKFQTVERAAQTGDRVNVDYRGVVDEDGAEDLEEKGVDFEIGEGGFIPGFEEGLSGASAGESISLDLVLPDDYPMEEMCGKPAVFSVRVNSVSEPLLPALDEAFLREFDFDADGEEAFRQGVRLHIEQEAEVALQSRFRDAALQALYDANRIEVPEVLVEAENRHTREQLLKGMNIRRIPEDISSRLAENPELKEAARRRVTLQLLIAEIIRSQELSVSSEKVREMIEQRAQNYDEPSTVLNWYYNDKDRLAKIEALALENEVIEWIASQARITEVSLSFDELMNKGQTVDP